MTESETLAWSSHLPALLACIGATTGPVLELGVGHFSTPVLHAICGAQGRFLASWESDPEWRDAFQHYSTWLHSFYCFPYERITSPAPLSFNLIRKWSVVLIDNSPGGKNRADCFAALLPVSDYVVVHDYERENYEHIAPLLSKEPTVRFHVTTTYQPPTLVASLTRTIPESILCL